MPPDSFFAGRSANGAGEQFGNARLSLAAGVPEQTAEKFDVFADAEVGIEVPAQALRHIGDAGADRGAMRGIRHVAAEHTNFSRLDLPDAGNDTQQRRFADAVGADQSDELARRKGKRQRVERERTSVTLRDDIEERDGYVAPAHDGASPRNREGHLTAGSVNT